MQRDDAGILDIVLACRDIAEFLQGIDQVAFLANKLVQSAVLRQLEVIGEATKRLSETLRENPPERSVAEDGRTT